MQKINDRICTESQQLHADPLIATYNGILEISYVIVFVYNSQ